MYVHLDVTSETDWQNAVKTATSRYGKLDILINNAAIVIPRVPIEERTVAEWDRVMAVNAKGVFLGTKHAIPAMRRAGGGSIVNISSVAGIGQSLHQEPAYAASKGAIRIFTKVTASQHAKDGIRCNSVHPGPIDTEMFHSAIPRPRRACERRLRARAARPHGHRGRDRDRRALPRLRRLVVHDAAASWSSTAARWRSDQGRGAAATSASLTRERFHRWWLDEHVPLVTILPDLRKYRVCLVTGSTSHQGREPWDGIAELWFDDRAALDARVVVGGRADGAGPFAGEPQRPAGARHRRARAHRLDVDRRDGSR